MAITVVTFGKITDSVHVVRVNTDVTSTFYLFENSGFFIIRVKNIARHGL